MPNAGPEREVSWIYDEPSGGVSETDSLPWRTTAQIRGDGPVSESGELFMQRSEKIAWECGPEGIGESPYCRALEGTAPRLGLLASMAFLLTVRNERDPSGLILTASEARRQRARLEAARRSAHRTASQLLSRKCGG
jgi:hypothetical protein